MRHYALKDYGPDPKNPWLENSDNGWGSYCWPKGVPAALLAIAKTEDGTNIKVRKELAPLLELLIVATEEALGYSMHTLDGGNTGGYNNRKIVGGVGPSTHSRGRAIDIRAHDNPQSYSFICTIPPAVVYLWESVGFYWGGRYKGVAYDPQHFSYIGKPKDVKGHMEIVQRFLDSYLEEGDMKADDKITIRDGYYPTQHPGAPVEREVTVQDAIARGVNYGASALNQLADLRNELKEIKGLLKK